MCRMEWQNSERSIRTCLEYDNKRTRSAADIGTAERVEEKSELELFREFYELQNNQSMTAQQEALVEELLRGMKG